MPRIWADTIDTHRRQVREAILDAAAELVVEHGPMSVAMSAVAERAAIGRATLYKYFPDVESILVAWHVRDFGRHLAELTALAEAASVTLADVTDFVRRQRRLHRHHQGADVVGTVAHAIAGAGLPGTVGNDVIGVLAAVMTRLAQAGEVRSDVDPTRLGRWVFHALHAPADIEDDAVVSLLASSLGPTAGRRRPTRGGPTRRLRPS